MTFNFKNVLATTVLACSLAIMPSAHANIDANAMPNINGAYGGSVNVNGNQMDVVVEGSKGSVGQFDWNSFDVGSDSTVNFGFTNHNQTSVNRVIGNNLSQIYGKLTDSCMSGASCGYDATGKVLLINPNGMIFGGGSTVNLNSFTASTFDLMGAKNLKDLEEAAKSDYINNLNVTNATFIKDGTLKTKDGAAINILGSQFNLGRSLGLAAENINIDKGQMPDGTYVNSLIKTSKIPYSYDTNGNPVTMSNTKIVTADGVTFNYQPSTGYISGVKLPSSFDNKVTNTISVNNTTIDTGNLYMVNAGAKAGSDINIKNTIIKGNKLVSYENGDIYIAGLNDINIDNSHFVGLNHGTTAEQSGSRFNIEAGKNVTITDTTMETAYAASDVITSGSNTGVNAKNGNIYISARDGNATITNSNLHAKGDLYVVASKDINATDSVLRARNYTTNPTYAPSANALEKSIVLDAENINLDGVYAESTDVMLVLAEENANIKNSTLNNTKNTLNILAKNTLIEDSTLLYNGLNFVEKTLDPKVNNVTIKGNTTVKDYSNEDGIKITTNGNLTVDAGSLKSATISGTIVDDTITDKNSAFDVKDDYLDANITISEAVDQKNITLESTQNAVTIKNGSNIATAGDINIIQALEFNSKDNLAAGNTLSAKNISITTKNADADINFQLDNLATLSHSERLALNAARNNNITGGAYNTSRVDFNAKNNNNITVSDLALTDSTFSGKTNNLTSKANVNLQDVSIKSQDGVEAKDTKTIINAKGDFTTGDKVLNLNSTKLIANADNNININLAGANNLHAGIEINNKYSSDQLSNKTVTINAADNTLAISRIKAGNLNLDKNDKFYAAQTTLTSEDLAGIPSAQHPTENRAYIEVANWGAFNLDPMATFDDFNTQPDTFTYTDHFVDGTHQLATGNEIDIYQKHYIEFNTDNTAQKFLLVYDKPVTGCEIIDPVDPPTEEPGDDLLFGSDSLINQVKLPRQMTQVTRIAPVANNTTDPTTGIFNAAARIELGEEDTAQDEQEENSLEI